MRGKLSVWMIPFGILLLTAGAAAQVHIEKSRGGFSASISETFPVSPGGELRMIDMIGDVQVEGGNADQVDVIQNFYFDVGTEEEAQKAFELYRARVSKVGNRVEVVGTKESWRRYVNASFRVKVPERFNAEVETSGGEVSLSQLKGDADLSTSGGDVRVTDVTGQVVVKTAGGEIQARNIEGTAILKTAGGDVELTDGKIGPFTLKTAGGSITLRTSQGNTDASTAGGNVEAHGIEGDLDLSTSGGEIILQHVKGKTHRAKTSGGDVEAQDVTGDVVLKTSGGEVVALRVQGNVEGSTSGGDIEIADVTGNVEVSTSGGELDLRHVGGRLIGETSGGDVKVVVGEPVALKYPIKLSTAGGEIEVRLPSDVKATISALIRIQDSIRDYWVRSDFKLKIEEEEVSKKFSRDYREVRATGDINGGGPLIELETVNGNIIIQKGN